MPTTSIKRHETIYIIFYKNALQNKGKYTKRLRKGLSGYLVFEIMRTILNFLTSLYFVLCK